MSETRLQDEYNKAIRACDIFVCLFFTKTGKFTEEEFDIAHRQFKDSGKPRIYTFFKNAEIKTGDARQEDFNSLWAFQKKLSNFGHFHTRYDNIEHLKRQFRDQLDKMLEGHD
jgi:internalin A